MARALNPKDLGEGLVCAKVKSDYLWQSAEHTKLTPAAAFCILDDANRILYGSMRFPSAVVADVTTALNRSSSGRLGWKNGGRQHLLSYWSMFLKHHFCAPKWTIVMSVPEAYVLAPIADFKKSFPLVVLLSFWVVLLLSIVHIRKSLVPLEKLMEGTKRIATKKFDSRVKLSSGDEFQQLGESFNTMAMTLGKQFSALTTIGEIDRAVLSSLDTEEIVKKAVGGLRQLLKCSCVSVTLVDAQPSAAARTFVSVNRSDTSQLTEPERITSAEMKELKQNPDQLTIVSGDSLPSYLRRFAGQGIEVFLVLPMFVEEDLAGMISLGFRDSLAIGTDDIAQARQLADQVAVGLANANLIRDLDQLNWGTLRALARTVDAKSPWTSGHSERVTRLAVKIGEELGLDERQLEDLQRGGLLHDIGKIGVPAHILDKPGKLNDEEIRVIRKHPRTGERIIEPIQAYGNVLSYIVQHHEHFDGNGYPDGTAGEDISLGARILALADAFDALASDRPYRAGMPLDQVVQLLEKQSGKQYDPVVVAAFLKVIETEGAAPGGKERQSIVTISDPQYSSAAGDSNEGKSTVTNRTHMDGGRDDADR